MRLPPPGNRDLLRITACGLRVFSPQPPPRPLTTLFLSSVQSREKKVLDRSAYDISEPAKPITFWNCHSHWRSSQKSRIPQRPLTASRKHVTGISENLLRTPVRTRQGHSRNTLRETTGYTLRETLKQAANPENTLRMSSRSVAGIPKTYCGTLK